MNRHSRQRRIGLRTSIFAAMVALCAVIVAATSGCSPAQRYRERHDAKSLFAALHKQVKSGDSLARVQELLGPGEPPPDPQRMLNATRRFAQRSPQDYPDGVSDGDTFVGFGGHSGGETISAFLQFRERRLVNFNPQNYNQVPMHMRLGGSP